MSKINKNGFSIAEVVIALSVIVIVSISALTIVFSSIVTKNSAINKAAAQNFANNVWESFKAAETEEEFLSLVNFAEEIELTESAPGENGSTVYIYSSEKRNFTAVIWVTYPNPVDEDPEIPENEATETLEDEDTGNSEFEDTENPKNEYIELPKNDYAEFKINVTDNNAKPILEFSYQKGYKTWD